MWERADDLLTTVMPAPGAVYIATGMEHSCTGISPGHGQLCDWLGSPVGGCPVTEVPSSEGIAAAQNLGGGSR